MKVLFKKNHELAKLPIKAKEGDACWDVHACDIRYLADGKVEVDLGFSTEFDKKYVGRIVPRSNLTKYWWIVNNSSGVIDSGYRGNWKVIFTPLIKIEQFYVDTGTYLGDAKAVQRKEYTEFPYQVGDRIAQIYFQQVLDIEFEEASDLSTSDRGEGGFGSTNLK